MLFQVGSKRSDYWQKAPYIGILLFWALLMAAAPMTVTQRHAETLAARALATQRGLGTPTLFAPTEVQWFAYVSPAEARLQQSWRTLDGKTVVPARVFSAPQVDLPRSPYGDATWNPLTDHIGYAPFVKPTLAYFVGVVHNASSKTAFQTALNAAVNTDIIEFTAAQTWTRGGVPAQSSARFPARGDVGHVLIRDAGTIGVMPAQGNRVTAATFAAAKTQTINANDSIWDFTNATRGWYLYGLHFKNAAPQTADCVRMLNIQASNTSGGNTTSIANIPKYFIVEGCYFENPWDSAYTTATRCALSPSIEYGWITENLMVGIASNGNECKGINASCTIGKINVENNGIEALTETIMWGGAAVVGDMTEVAADIYHARNYLYRRTEWMTPSTLFQYTNHKNFFENKQGIRQVVERNECSGHSGKGQQNDLAIKHACPGGANDVGRVQCNNNVYRYNRFENSANQWAVATTTSATWTPNGTFRIEIYGNLSWAQHPTFVSGSSSVNRLLLSDLASPSKKLADIYVHHNTYQSPNKCMAIGGNLTQNANGAPNFRFMNNVDYAATHQYNGPFADGGATGVTVLNNISGAGGWTWAGNVAIGSGTQVWSGIPGNYVVPTAQLAFVDTATGNYKLVSYANYTGTDGNAPGVDYDHMNTFLTGVRTGAHI